MANKHSKIADALVLSFWLALFGQSLSMAKNKDRSNCGQISGVYLHLKSKNDINGIHTNTKVEVYPADAGKISLRISFWGDQSSSGMYEPNLNLKDNIVSFASDPYLKRFIFVKFSRNQARVVEGEDNDGAISFRNATVCRKISDDPGSDLDRLRSQSLNESP